MATVIGSASIRLSAEDAGLKEQINRDLNDAIKSSKINSDPLVAVQQQLRASELDLVKAQQQQATAEDTLAKAETTLTRLRSARTQDTKAITAAELAFYRAELELSQATDKVSAAERTAASVEAALTKATRDVAAAKADATNRTSLFSKVLGVFRGTVNSVLHPISSTRSGVVSLGGSLKDLGTKLVSVPIKAVGNLFDDFGTKSKNASRTLASGAWSGFKKLITESVASPLTVATGGFRGLQTLGSGALSLLTNKMVLFGAGGAAALGPLMGMLLALPGLAVAGGAAMAVLKLGADGLKAATKQLTPEFDKLKASVSAVFARQLTPVFATLRPVLAALVGPLDQVAGGVSTVIKQLVGVVNTRAGIDQIRTALAGAGQFITAMGPGLAALLRTFLTLASTVAPEMHALGASIGSIFGAIQGAISDLSGAGNISRIFGDLPSVFSGLGAVIRPLLVILGQFAAYLTGPLGQVLQAIGSALTSAESGFNDFGVGVGAALGNLAEPLKAIGPLLGQVASLVGSVLFEAIRAIEPALTTLIQGLSAGLQPVLPLLTEALSSLALALQPIANVLIKALLSVITALLPMVPPLVQFIAQLATMFGQLLTALLPILPPILQLATALFPLLMSILQAAMPILAAVVTGVTPIIAVLAQLVSFVAGKVIPIIQAFLPVVSGVFQSVAKIITDVMTIVKGIVQTVLGLLTGNWREAMSGIKSIVSGGWNLIRDTFTGALNAIKGAVSAAIGGVISFFRSLPSGILHTLGGLGSLLVGAGRDLIMGLVRGIEGAVSAAYHAVTKALGGLLSGAKHLLGISSPSKIFHGYGVFIMQGLANGIAASTRQATQAVAKAASQVVSAFTPALTPSVNVGALGAVMASTAPRPSNAAGQPGSDTQALHDAIVEALTGWQVKLSAQQAATEINRVNKRAGINR